MKTTIMDKVTENITYTLKLTWVGIGVVATCKLVKSLLSEDE